MRPVSVFRYLIDGKDEITVVNFKRHSNIKRGRSTLCTVDPDCFMTILSFMGHTVGEPQILDVEDYKL